MASLLVYVELAWLASLVDLTLRDSGAVWRLEPGVLGTELDRLDDDGMLFLCTIDSAAGADKPMLIGWAEDFDFDDLRFAGADVRLRDHDLAELLPRLGCTQDLATFASPPRVLPPGDVELVRYALALADDRVRPPPPPEPIARDDDEELRTLRAAVLAEPRADEPRTIYADALQARGDPRGELIALQLARATADTRPTDRERVLLRRCGDACLGQLAPFIMRYELERGFLHSCTTAHPTPMPNPVARDPLWVTVERLHTTDRGLLLNPELRVKQLGIAGNELLMLARARYDLPFEKIGGLSHTGARFEADWDEVMQSRAFGKLRTLSLDYARLREHRRLPALLGGRLGRQLEHLDVWLDVMAAPPVELLYGLFTVPLRRLTLRFDLPPHPATARIEQVRVTLGFERDLTILEVSAQLEPASVDHLVQFIAPLAANRGTLALSARNPELGARLGALFGEVIERNAASIAP